MLGPAEDSAGDSDSQASQSDEGGQGKKANKNKKDKGDFKRKKGNVGIILQV